MKDWTGLLDDECSGIAHEAPFGFSAHCSIGCGGGARAAFYPANTAELLLLVDLFKREGVKFLVLGNMSNVLPADGMYEGAVIFTKRLRSVGIGQTVFAMAGVKAKAFFGRLRTARQERRGIPRGDSLFGRRSRLYERGRARKAYFGYPRKRAGL